MTTETANFLAKVSTDPLVSAHREIGKFSGQIVQVIPESLCAIRGDRSRVDFICPSVCPGKHSIVTKFLDPITEDTRMLFKQ